MNIRLGSARTILLGPVLDTDGAAKTDEVVASVLASKNGGNPTALDGSATLTHKQTGFYLLALTANDISALGCLEISLNSGTNTMPVIRLNVLTAAAWDALHAASGGYLPSYVNGILATALTETSAGYLAAAFKKLFDVATPLLVASDVMRGTDSAALASVVGALADAAADGDPTTADTLMQYVKQLINTLVGTAGIPTFPAESAPSDTVSLAEVIRAIHADVTGLNGSAMRGTDSAALASVCTEGRLAELDAANLPTDVAAVKTDTGNLVSRITATLFTGITSLSEWLGLLAGKQVGNATALTEIKATGAGSGTFSELTDSLEAVRDTAPLGTAMRGTDSAALASICTEARLAELDAANLPTDVANVKTDTAAILLDTGTDGVVVAAGSKTGLALSATGADLITSAATFATAIADAVLKRSVATVEGTAAEWSLCTVVLAMLESSISGTTWTIKRTDGSTTHATKTVTVDADADPITGVT